MLPVGLMAMTLLPYLRGAPTGQAFPPELKP